MVGTHSDGTSPSPSDAPLTLDAILSLLANYRRRRLLAYLWAQPDQVGSFEAATREVAAAVASQRGGRPSLTDVNIDLQHTHLPKLADAGVLEYDIRSQVIRYRGHDRLETAYERVIDLERSKPPRK